MLIFRWLIIYICTHHCQKQQQDDDDDFEDDDGLVHFCSIYQTKVTPPYHLLFFLHLKGPTCLRRCLATSSWAVWPDGIIKDSRISPKVVQNVLTSVRCKKCHFYNSSKLLLNIWTTFARNFVPKNFQKSPKLVTLFVIVKWVLELFYFNEDWYQSKSWMSPYKRDD